MRLAVKASIRQFSGLLNAAKGHWYPHCRCTNSKGKARTSQSVSNHEEAQPQAPLQVHDAKQCHLKHAQLATSSERRNKMATAAYYARSRSHLEAALLFIWKKLQMRTHEKHDRMPSMTDRSRTSLPGIAHDALPANLMRGDRRVTASIAHVVRREPMFRRADQCYKHRSPTYVTCITPSAEQR